MSRIDEIKSNASTMLAYTRVTPADKVRFRIDVDEDERNWDAHQKRRAAQDLRRKPDGQPESHPNPIGNKGHIICTKA